MGELKRELKILVCGACGGSGVRLFGIVVNDQYNESLAGIEAECLKCKSRTVFSVPKPMIQVSWHVEASGILYPTDK